MNRSQSQSLPAIAETYLAMGWAVIPTAEKVAAVPWRPFQSRRPSQEQLTDWFATDGYTGIAILTGPVSQLAVLDFDDPAAFLLFATRHPHLGETRTVRTRRGYHLYYHLPPYPSVTSRSAAGVDLQYNGKYVVAPPSVVAGHTYAVIRGGCPRTLSANDVVAITRFLDSRRESGAESPSVTLTGVKTPNIEISAAERLSAPETGYSGGRVRPTDLAALYRCTAAKNGRNAALFKLACLGRDNGLSREQVLAALAGPHAAQPPGRDHRRETAGQRHHEAIRTIQSAFARPARTGLHRYPEPEQLPNPVREVLFRQNQTGGVRVIEGLRLKGIQPGQPVTRKQAVELLRGIVGRDSVYAALNAVLGNGQPLFERVKPPLPRTPSPPSYGVAKTTVPRQNSKCLEFELPKPGKTPTGGRPPEHFTMPTNLELAEKLGVKRSTLSDELTGADLKSAKTTRTACHTGLIKRRPGQYSIRFFARRLGISERTVYRYNAEDDHIHAEPVYLDRPVFWHNLEAVIPPDPSYFPHEGVFLVASDRKYPPQRPIARKLLAKRQLVTLRTRLANYWWYGDRDAPMPARLQADYHAVLDRLEQAAARRCKLSTPPREYPAEKLKETPPLETRRKPTVADARARMTPPRKPVQPPHTKVNYGQSLSDPEDEALARHTYRSIHEISKNGEGTISLESARRWVHRFGRDAVRRALQVATTRRNIRNPAGFISTYLRSEAVAKSWGG